MNCVECGHPVLAHAEDGRNTQLGCTVLVDDFPCSCCRRPHLASGGKPRRRGAPVVANATADSALDAKDERVRKALGEEETT